MRSREPWARMNKILVVNQVYQNSPGLEISLFYLSQQPLDDPIYPKYYSLPSTKLVYSLLKKGNTMPVRIHPTADVSDGASIGDSTSIWHHAQIREKVTIGQECIIGKGVYIDAGVKIGNRVKIQNYVSVYHGVIIEDGVFVGPHVCFTNDLYPRAINPDGSLKAADDWILSETLICVGAALGANSTIVCGTKIGAWSMVGSGSVVTQDVPDYGLVFGNPARLHGFICPCGTRLMHKENLGLNELLTCPECKNEYKVSFEDWMKIDD